MRGLSVAIAAIVLGLGVAGPASADPPRPAPTGLPPGWSWDERGLSWTSERIIPPGDAAVEFWSGERLLGRARGGPDLRTFVLSGGVSGRLTDLRVRIGGKRVDAAAPPRARTAGTPSEVPEQPAHPIDPGIPGPYATTTGEYTLPGIRLSTYPEPVEMQGVVVAPKGAPGKRPLALFLHGRHWTCFIEGDDDTIIMDWPCWGESEPVPSHRGYLQAQRLLASQGYVTVSISANGINGQDDADTDGGARARSALIRTHLAHWADWSGSGRNRAPAAVKAAPRADLDRVFLMGHSRGGEGVNRAALDSLDPPPAGLDDYRGRVRWTIRGLFLVGPTIFGHNPQPDVPSATILPGCDGDVADLQGQMYVDATRGVSAGRALHSALYMVGANHNYFNTEWTPGQAVGPAFDDFWVEDDPLCTAGLSPARLSPQQQQTAGATYIATAARLFVAGDDRVRPLLDGTGVRAPSAGPARVPAHAIGANRGAAIIPDTDLTLRGARLCEQVPTDPEQVCGDTDRYAQGSPHFVPFREPEPGRYAIQLDRAATIRPATPMAVAGAEALAMRLIVPPNTPATTFTVAVTDDRGRRTGLGTATVTGLPGSDGTMSYWAQEVRLRLPAHVRTIAGLEIVAEGDRPAWLIDAWGWRPGSPAPRPADLDRVDVGTLTVDENDEASTIYTVPVRIDGDRPARIRLFLTDARTYETRNWVADIAPGTTSITVPVAVAGNTTYGGDRRYVLSAKAVRGAVVGDHGGGVLVHDDESIPEVTITPAVTAAEGTPLTWTINLSAPADEYLYLRFLAWPPATGPELSSTDVDPAWFTENSGEDPEPSRPLSGTALRLHVPIEPGTTTLELTVPTVTDATVEGPEHLRLLPLLDLPDTWWPIELPMVDGTVTG
ncbi:hypothetical protein Aca07nite_66160 [Actinoplanes capillaceus]|uniref:Secreted protein n=1 Tax=Actinoplanes campanulatus TaxID=113559 RepID=A0ABQ3WSS8_9ACTN|nr:hypothetical protein [Actinoplanes capillaceus]GID49341.1 hypothetical protein Aca07nite_66160 [Actinoplanes capillaceus]